MEMKKYYIIYKTTNKINNKSYIGKHITSNIDDGYLGSGVVLKLSIKKYGIENFERIILEFCDDDDQLNEMEYHYIMQYNTYKNEYNLTLGGDGSAGRVLSEESIRKMCGSNKGKGRPRTEIFKQQCSERRRGQKTSIETRMKQSMSAKNKPPMKEITKQKMSNSRKRENLSIETRKKKSESVSGNKNPMAGRTHTEETKKKISDKAKMRYENEKLSKV